MLEFLKKWFRGRAAATEQEALRTAVVGQHQAEAGLRESEEHFVQLVGGVRDYAVFLLDRQGNIRTWNSGAQRIKGYTAEEIIGQHFSRFYTREAVASGWPAHELSVAAATGRFEDEGWRLRKDGSRFWANVVITALRDETGEVRGFLKITRDLTDRKQAEDKIRLSEERFRLLVEGVKDYAIFMLDPEGRITTWNAGAQRIKGYTAEEIIGQHFSRFYPREAVERGWPDEELKRATAEGQFEDEGWRLRKDGSRFWANVVITALRDETGTLRGFGKVTRDMTERRQAEENARRLLQEEAGRKAAEDAAQEIERQRQQLQVTLSSIGDGVIVTDSKGDVTFLNPVAAGLTGWPSHEAAGQPLERVIPILNEQTRQTIENPVRRAFRDKAVVQLANHTVLVARNGREVPVEDSAAPICQTDGTIAGAVLVFRDVTEARRSQEARHYLAAIVESSDDAIIGQTLDGRIASWNRGAERLYGYGAAEIVGRPLAVLVPPDHPDELPGIVEQVERGERIEHYETVRVRKDGSRVDVSLTISPVKNAEGKVIGASKIARDISERKRVEEALRRSEARFRQLADAMPQIVWTTGTDGIIDYFNRRWYEFTGLPDGVGNEGWRDILHPDDGPTAAARWAESQRTGTPFEMEIRLLEGATGGYRWHLLRTVPVRGDAGTVARWYGTATDINQQKRAEESAGFLARASAALASLVDYESTLQKVVSLAVPYFADWSAVDVAGEAGSWRRLAVAHQQPQKVRLAQELLRRYPPDPEANGGIAHVFRTGRPDMIEEVTDEMLEQGARDEEHLRLLRALGLRSFICVPLVVAGKTFGVLTFATAESGRRYDRSDLALAEDLTHRAGIAIENARLYKELREVDRRKDEFLATLAHELRNPLAPLRNSLQVLKMPSLNAETTGRAREMMERQLEHLVRLVDDLLDVSRVMRGKIQLRKERVQLASVVARAVETAQPLIAAQGHELTLGVPEEALPVEADPVRLAQVVANLLTNAAKYTEPGGRIWLTARREGEVVVLRVRDTGIGIAPEMLPRIFDLFVQVDHAATRSQGGLGIGLTLVKNLVEMHHGSVEAHSPGLGQGSEFVLRLPLATPRREEAPAEDRGERTPASDGRRLLVVDDNKDAADSLAMLLRLLGHEVRVVYDGPAALEMVKSYRPELVLLDIGMPDMDGYEVARRLRQEPGLGNVKLAALTGWGQQEDRRRTAEAGFDAHLVKPVEPRALEALLGGASGRDKDGQG